MASKPCYTEEYRGFRKADPSKFRTVQPPHTPHTRPRSDQYSRSVRPAVDRGARQRGDYYPNHQPGNSYPQPGNSRSSAPRTQHPQGYRPAQPSGSTFNPLEFLLMLLIILVVLVSQ